ncbi:MAG: peroxide stress protein YaaA [Magnetococcales bacterium]|nr:peroxide stress protein YaaA [Magnetococcales bacterium]
MLMMLLSPAKTMTWHPVPAGLPTTLPDFLPQAETLTKVVLELNLAEIRQLMNLSIPLGQEALNRFHRFSPPFTLENSRPAALYYRGDTYVGLDADTLSLEDWSFAQERLVILSGFYGVLRPLDLIQPYRLEMGVSLANERGKNLYAFWGESLTQWLDQRLGGKGTVINLASEEYGKAIQPQGLQGRMITPVFQEIRQGKAQVIGLLAKRARGRMARFIIDHRVTEASQLQSYQQEGYTFNPATSTENRWIFARES